MKDKKVIVGYATGVFDMFHIGHLNIIRRAKSVCDKLIVGVCTDRLVRELKDKDPIIPFEERSEIVRNIKFVDEVVAQDKRDEISDFHKYHFDVMIKGDSWQESERWNKLEKEFEKLGVEVKYFPYTKHISSTLLREKISQKTEKRKK